MSRAYQSSSESTRTISGGTETDDSDFPPDSIVVPITDDTPWRYSAYDSGESTREITNPKSHSKAGPSPSQVAAVNLNATALAPIMGIHAKMKLPALAHNQRPPSIFPRWRNSKLRKSGLSYSEPGSPKVSCWGKILSESEKEKLRKQKEARRELERNNEVPSCCSQLSVIFTCVGDRGAGRRGDFHFQMAEVHPQHLEEIWQSSKENISSKEVEVSQSSSVAGEGEARREVLQRFSSCRRDEAWGSDLAEEKKEGVAAQENSLN